MKKVVNAIDLILTNQRNDFLIQWEEGKTRQPKRYKDKLYAEIRYQISSYAIREIHNILKELWIPKKKCVTTSLHHLFSRNDAVPYAHELAWLIYQDKPIPLEYIHWHWSFTRCLDWDSRESQKGQRMRKYHVDPEPEPTPSPPPQHTSSTENHRDFPPPRNFHEDEGNSNSENHDSETDSSQQSLGYNDQSQNIPSQPTNNSSRTAANQAVFPLDPRLKEIQEPLIVKPRGRPSDSLNKKRSQKSHDFEQSTRREPSRFEHVERNILASQQGIRRSGIRGKAIRRDRNRPQGRSDPTSTPGSITGILTEMTSVFRI